MKKVISILIAVLLLAVAPLQVMATEDPTFIVGNVSAKPGETVQVPVSIGNNSGIIAFLVRICYDANVLTLVSVENSKLFNGGTYVMSGSMTANPYTVSWEDSLSHENYTADGVLFTLTFTVSEDAQIGETPITIEYDPGSVFDTRLCPVAFATRSGAVDIVPARIPPEIVALDGSPAVIDRDKNYIYGLREQITEEDILRDYLGAIGDGHLEIDANMGLFGTGAKVRLVDEASNETLETYTIIIFGDLDGDGAITVQDIAISKNMNAMLIPFTMRDAEAVAADIFEDGRIDNQDITLLKKLQANLVVIDQATKRITET